MKDWDFSKPLGQRRPKVMERMPDPPAPKGFEVDEEKLREGIARSRPDAWEKQTAPEKMFFGTVYAFGGVVLLSIFLAIIAGLVLLAIAFPSAAFEFLIGIAVFVVIIVLSQRRETPSGPQKRT